MRRKVRRLAQVSRCILTAMMAASTLQGASKATIRDVRPALAFEANQGQAETAVRYLARGRGYSLLLKDREAVLAVRQARLRMQLVGGNASPAIRGREEQPGRSNYLIGNDPSRWHTDVPHFAKVEYREVYPGVDLIYYGNPAGDLEYDFVVAPGADASAIRLDVRGAEHIALDASGDLLLSVRDGAVRLHKPVIYQEHNGMRQPVAGGFVRRGKHGIAFQVAEYDRTRPLVIDPSLGFSMYLGGSGNDFMGDAVTDASDNIYVTGNTASANFPTTSGAASTASGGGTDAFVTKIGPDGTVIYSTFLGGSGSDFSLGIAVGSDGSVYVAGYTNSTNFPTTNALQAASGGGNDAFLTKLNPAGTALTFSTYLGGSGSDLAAAVAVGSDGSVYVTGTPGTGFPTKNPLATSGFAFLSKFTSAGGLTFSTYVGGTGGGTVNGLAVDSQGNSYLCGNTLSAALTTPGAYQTTVKGSADWFAMKVNAAGSAVVFGTLLGSTGFDLARKIAVDSAGNVYVAGEAGAAGFPTAVPFQAASGGGDDGFLAILNPTGTALLAGTYFGGSGGESVTDLRIIADGGGKTTVMLAGTTSSTNFPLKNPVLSTSSGVEMFYIIFDITGGGAVADPGQMTAAARGTAGVITAMVHVGSSLVGGNGKSSTPIKAMPFKKTGAVVVGNTNAAVPGATGTPPGAYDGLLTSFDGITLPACTYTLSPTSFVHEAAETAGSFVLSTPQGCNWTAVSNQPFVIVDTDRGTGSGLIRYRVTENIFDTERTATITVQDQTFTVYQEGTPCSGKYSTVFQPQGQAEKLSIQAYAVPSNAGAATISVSAPSSCRWSAASDSDWLAVSPNLGTGPGVVTASWAANNGTRSRNGTTKVATSIWIINQDAPPAPALGGTVGASGACGGGTAPNPGAFATGPPVAAAGSCPASGGGAASLYGTGFATGISVADKVPLPTTLGGTKVTLSNSPGSQTTGAVDAALFFASENQINFQVPWEFLGQNQASLTVTVLGVTSSPVTVPLAPASAPGIFTINQAGTGQGVVQIANTVTFAAPTGSIPGVDTRPAVKGTDFLTIYCTGLGDVTNRPASGAAAPGGPLAATKVTPTVTIGGVPATVSFSGLTPGFVGLYQVNVQVPASAPSGSAVNLVINMGTVASNTVTIAVQ